MTSPRPSNATPHPACRPDPNRKPPTRSTSPSMLPHAPPHRRRRLWPRRRPRIGKLARIAQLRSSAAGTLTDLSAVTRGLSSIGSVLDSPASAAPSVWRVLPDVLVHITRQRRSFVGAPLSGASTRSFGPTGRRRASARPQQCRWSAMRSPVGDHTGPTLCPTSPVSARSNRSLAPSASTSTARSGRCAVRVRQTRTRRATTRDAQRRWSRVGGDRRSKWSRR